MAHPDKLYKYWGRFSGQLLFLSKENQWGIYSSKETVSEQVGQPGKIGVETSLCNNINQNNANNMQGSKSGGKARGADPIPNQHHPRPKAQNNLMLKLWCMENRVDIIWFIRHY